MPRARRDKVVSLTKVKKKNRGTKENLVTEIRSCSDTYPYIYAFNLENLRSSGFKDVRQHFKTNSRFFFGKNSVMGIALGKTKETEYAEGLFKLGQHLSGQCALMFSKVPPSTVTNYFQTFHKEDFARAGDIATDTFDLPAGPLPQFAFSMEPQLRKMGMPTTLDKGVVTLVKEMKVCTKEEKLNPEQCKILKAFDYKMADFRLGVSAIFEKGKGLKIL
uniref:Ribosome assembly factor mrt4 n=1 Tax=Rhabditophanes sp. KR3021 TaxID=114890 RepID=A0AC35U0J2_9BILA